MSAAVRAGYKQTEVGVIPVDWEVLPIIKLFQLKQGVQCPIGGQSPVEGEGRKRFIRIVDLTSSNEEWRYIADPGETHHVSNDDLFMVRYGCPGLVGFGCEGVVANNLFRLIPKKRIEGHFYYHYLANRQDEIAGLSGSSTMPAVSFSTLNLLYVVNPSLQEQRSIATALSDVDALLAKLDALIAKKRDLKTAAMQQLLTGQTRLPGFSGEWEVKRLGDITECLDNLRVPLNESQRNQMRGDYPYCGANGVLDFVNDYVLDDDVILMAEDGGYFDEYAYRPIAYRMIGKCWINNHAHILKAKAGFDQTLLFYLLVHKNIQSFLASGTRAKLNKSQMNKIEVCLAADVHEQTAIATFLSDMDTELTALEARRDKTRAIKLGMMQELLTGRIRLI